MNPDKTLHDYLEEQLQDMYSKRKGDPQEGDVIHDIYGTQVYLKGQWNVVDYNKPDEVQSLREQWAEMAQQKRLNEKFDRIQLSRNNGKSTGVHLHVGKDLEDEKVYTEVELDNATLESYTQGKRDFANELLQLLAAEENELRTYGRTELYGIHKAVSVIQQALNDIQ